MIGQVSCDYMFGKAKTFPVCSIFNKDVGSYKAGTRNCLCQEVENNNIPQEGAQVCYLLHIYEPYKHSLIQLEML